eukprot:7414254-Pyramimonas_sp.AAC.1
MTSAQAAHSFGGHWPAQRVRRSPRWPTWKPRALNSPRRSFAKGGAPLGTRPPPRRCGGDRCAILAT